MIAVWAFALGCSEPGGKQPSGGGPRDSVHASDDTGTPVEDDGIGLQFVGAHPKNLLVISVDTLRRDYSGLFDDKGLTPNLTSIFSAGVVLQDHHSCSNWTTPSFICAQTGRFPFDDGYWPTALNVAAADARVDWPPPDLETLSSLLTTAGYRTELITTNSMFSLEQNGGAYGFQTETRAFDKNATVAVDLAIDAADHIADGSVPWYLHVHFMDPHGPYGAPAEYLPDPALDCAKWDLRTQTSLTDFMWNRYPNSDPHVQALMMACLLNDYGAEIRYFDDEFARLWSQFDSKGLLDDTLVVFYSDHGEQFDEHGRFQHIWSLYAEENAAVAAFWAKNIEPVWWAGPTIHQDIAPTILDALRVPQGKHTGAIVGQANDDRVMLTFNSFNGWGETSIAVLQGEYKLMYWWAGGKRYFDTGVDAAEQVDLYDPTDPQMLELWKPLESAIGRAQENWPTLIPIDPVP